MKFICLKELYNAEITRNIITLSGGSIIAQLIPALMNLILARLYTSEDYGNFSIFISYAGIIAVFISARYEYAIVRPSKEIDALHIVVLSVLIALSLTFLLMLFIVLDDLFQFHLLNVPCKYGLLLFALSIALLQVLTNYANRKEYYKLISLSAVMRSVMQAVSRMTFGVFYVKGGLIFGCIIGIWGGIGCLLHKIGWYDLQRSFSWKRMRELALVYVNFPRFLLPSALLNVLSTNLPIILLAQFYSKDDIGQFAMANAILYMPITLIANAFGQIFYKKACSWSLVQTSTLALRFLMFAIFLSSFVLGIVFIGGERLFAFALGENWGKVGEYSICLSPWFMTVFCLSPLGWIFDAKDRQKTEMLLNLGLFVGRILTVLLCGMLQFTFYFTLLLYGLLGCLFWLVEGVFIFHLLKMKMSPFLKLFLVSYLSVLFFVWIRFVW